MIPMWVRVRASVAAPLPSPPTLPGVASIGPASPGLRASFSCSQDTRLGWRSYDWKQVLLFSTLHTTTSHRLGLTSTSSPHLPLPPPLPPPPPPLLCSRLHLVTVLSQKFSSWQNTVKLVDDLHVRTNY